MAPDEGAGGAAEVERGVVRLAPDYAGTVIWFPHAVPYAQTHLDPSLVTDLIRWELSYYDSLTEDFGWRSPQAAVEYTAAGIRLALRMALQLGPAFDIEFASYEDGVAPRRFRSDCPADNPRAAAAFTELCRAWAWA